MTRQPETEELPSIESLAEAADRASRLQRVTERLSGAITPQEVLDAILTDGLRAAEARAGAIGIVADDGQAIELLAERGYEPRVMEEWGRFPVAAADGPGRTTGRNRPGWLGNLGSHLASHGFYAGFAGANRGRD